MSNDSRPVNTMDSVLDIEIARIACVDIEVVNLAGRSWRPVPHEISRNVRGKNVMTFGETEVFLTEG